MATKPFLSQIAVPVGTTTGDVYYPQTSLLMHFNGTNGSTTMTDNSKNNLTATATNGTAISTAQSRLGGSSVFFDGTNDYLTVTNSGMFGSGNWTIEFWVYAPAGQTDKSIIEARNSAAGVGTTTGFTITMVSATEIRVWSGSELIKSTVSYVNQWVNICLVKNGSTTTMYINGTNSGTTTSLGTMSDTSFIIGAGYYGSVSLNAFGNFYMDELRITTGIARYTSNFTPSTTQFLDSTGDANSNVVVNSTATGFAIGTGGINGAQLAKAWVNFNGTGTVAIRDSYNVSSITDNGTGNYTVNYSTAFSNANYCVNASVRNFSVIAASGGSITTTGVTVNTNNASMTSEDTSYVFVSIFSN